MNEANLENVECAICGLLDTTTIYDSHDRNWRLEGRFKVVKCSGCGLVYVNPRPVIEDIWMYYPETFMVRSRIVDGDMSDFKMHGKSWKEIMGAVAAPILRHRTTGKVLDVGSGDGLFLAFMKSVGWDAYGVEPRKEAAAASEKQFGIKVFQGLLHEAPFKKFSFDVITLNNVFEHVHEPVKLLNETCAFLKQDGLLVIDVPNFNALESRIFRDRWVALDLPRHLYHYTRETITKMLVKGGLEVLEIIEDSDIGPYKMGYVESLRHLVMDLGLKKYPDKIKSVEIISKKNYDEKKSFKSGIKEIGHKTENMAFSAIGGIAKRLGAGSRIVVIAKKGNAPNASGDSLMF